MAIMSLMSTCERHPAGMYPAPTTATPMDPNVMAMVSSGSSPISIWATFRTTMPPGRLGTYFETGRRPGRASFGNAIPLRSRSQSGRRYVLLRSAGRWMPATPIHHLPGALENPSVWPLRIWIPQSPKCSAIFQTERSPTQKPSPIQS